MNSLFIKYDADCGEAKEVWNSVCFTSTSFSMVMIRWIIRWPRDDDSISGYDTPNFEHSLVTSASERVLGFGFSASIRGIIIHRPRCLVHRSHPTGSHTTTIRSAKFNIHPAYPTKFHSPTCPIIIHTQSTLPTTPPDSNSIGCAVTFPATLVY
jgi:hypothetical protein